MLLEELWLPLLLLLLLLLLMMMMMMMMLWPPPQGGWNRWAHKSTVGPIEMTPPKAGDHFQATVKVPKNAWSMDFVFSDVMQGDGTYDNRGGLDYHLETTGSTTKETQMHVCHISVEMAPIAKVGSIRASPRPCT